MSRFIIRLWVYILPLPLVAAMYVIWVAWSRNSIFALYVIMLPLLYGYLVPGIATNLMNKWRFKGPWVVGRFYAHHGFMYAANMAPLLFIAFLGTPRDALSAGSIARILICTGALHGFVLWIHDILIVRHGMVEIYNRPSAEGRSPEEIVTHYAPGCFFLIGLCYAAAALLAFQVFVVQHEITAGSISWTFLAGTGLLIAVPSLGYRLTETK